MHRDITNSKKTTRNMENSSKQSPKFLLSRTDSLLLKCMPFYLNNVSEGRLEKENRKYG